MAYGKDGGAAVTTVQCVERRERPADEDGDAVREETRRRNRQRHHLLAPHWSEGTWSQFVVAGIMFGLFPKRRVQVREDNHVNSRNYRLSIRSRATTVYAHNLILVCELQQVVRHPRDRTRIAVMQVVGAVAHRHALVVHDARVLAVRHVLLGTGSVPHLGR